MVIRGRFLILLLLLASGRAACAGPPRLALHARPGPARALDVAEALIEDLSARNLALYDRRLDAGAGPGTVVRLTWHGREGIGPARGEPANLAGYLRLLSPGGVVTGRFHDWRTPSVYRVAAGLHNGYDIAYPPGTAIAAGWGGRVTAVLNWYGTEYGITVASPQGFRTTYGHLAPLVRVGALVRPGDTVGRVVRDHVDVKMRAEDGRFVDFALGVPGPGSAAVAPATHEVVLHSPAPAASPPARLPGPVWTRDPAAVRAALAYLRARHEEVSLLSGRAEPSYGERAAIRLRVAEARERLERAGVAESVLLAAFIHTPALQEGSLEAAGVPADDADGAAEALREQARAGIEELRDLLRSLNS